MFSLNALIVLAFTGSALARPTARWSPNGATGCDIGTVPLDLPAGPELAVPAGRKLMLATVATGVQNYTCSDGVWVSAGALADLYDIACPLAEAAKLGPGGANELAAALSRIAFDNVPFPSPDNGGVAVKHEFIPTDIGIAPKFARVSGPFVVGSKVGEITPDASAISWLRLEALAGMDGLAKTVLRTNTVQGVPPPTCGTEGNELSVPYAANYYFLGRGSLGLAQLGWAWRAWNAGSRMSHES